MTRLFRQSAAPRAGKSRSLAAYSAAPEWWADRDTTLILDSYQLNSNSTMDNKLLWLLSG
jgi:hypothetical protein